MAGELPYMRLWVRDLLSDPDVQEMEPDEFGAYMRLLCHAWVSEGVPSDARRRARILGVSTQREAALWEAVGPKFESNGNGRLVNARQERERGEAMKLSAAGRAGAEARWGQRS